ncbi:tyrosine-type recombinase/integrase (plasmid) [Streptomyces sp. NBC_01220]|uniref:tyrosine-type recombinase/integrase n=1 Tax=Streptomyces sp. NBC_01220 TaxID=2903781 RepID=UPI002F909C6A|nr:tyrosine-type recombinase/integrase [Streptomyces sp. NBC_01220]
MPADSEVVVAELVDDDEHHLPAVPAEPFDINRTLTPEAAESTQKRGRENTRQTYEDRWKAFANWCAENGGRSPGPETSEENLVSYVDFLCRKNTVPGTIRLSIAAIRHTNARARYPDTPNQDAALDLYRDHRYAWNEAGYQQRSAPPLDLIRIRQMIATCPDHTLAGLRDRVLLLLGYYMRARRSELTKLRIADVQFPAPDLMVATKRVTKADKDSEGKEYEIDDPTAIGDVQAYLTALDALGQKAPHLPLLRSVDQWGNLGGISKGRGISTVAVNTAVKRIAKRANLDVAADVTAHGLRAGVPTDLGAAGYSAAEIKDMTGDWSSTEQVETYRKIGRRRVGKKSDEGRRSGALSMLRVQENA